ncbi:GGDEF domain-containing protein, partial [Clostridiaceae bacterium HSG29]|nr:GGDEF domain-containing protein [Clostridiaceae bacterium HSG29]
IICIYEYIKINDNYKKELLKLSTIDHLCGIYNNRYYKQRIAEEISKARRINSKIGLLIFDIDNFKKINDTYGHHEGDLILKKLSEEISKIIRTEDVFCRYAGDEFIIIITYYNNPISNKIIARINNLLNKINTENSLTVDSRLNISAGLSIYPDDAQNEIELFKNADHSLYESKKHEGTVFTSFSNLIQ